MEDIIFGFEKNKNLSACSLDHFEPVSPIGRGSQAHNTASPNICRLEMSAPPAFSLEPPKKACEKDTYHTTKKHGSATPFLEKGASTCLGMHGEPVVEPSCRKYNCRYAISPPLPGLPMWAATTHMVIRNPWVVITCIRNSCPPPMFVVAP